MHRLRSFAVSLASNPFLWKISPCAVSPLPRALEDFQSEALAAPCGRGAEDGTTRQDERRPKRAWETLGGYP